MRAKKKVKRNERQTKQIKIYENIENTSIPTTTKRTSKRRINNKE